MSEAFANNIKNKNCVLDYRENCQNNAANPPYFSVSNIRALTKISTLTILLGHTSFLISTPPTSMLSM